MGNQSKIRSEDVPKYTPLSAVKPSKQADDDIIRQALNILHGRLVGEREALHNPEDVKNYLRLKLTELEHEVFACLFLDSQHRVIQYEEMFRGTINGASVHPREVVKRALQLNAAAVIFSHNHPSGVPEPSHSDRHLTKRLQEALELVEIRVLDHVIVGSEGMVTFSERGWV